MAYVRAHCGDGVVMFPCRDCKNAGYKSKKQVDGHLHVSSMLRTYTNWIHHGEENDAPGIITDLPEDVDPIVDEGSIGNDGFSLLENMYPYARESGFNPLLSRLIEDAKRPVGPDTKVTRL